MRHKKSTDQRRNAFTLIELLVVVAIIALLLAILIPSIGKARDQAKTSACLANLHGIGIASAAYSADNMGYIVPSYINKFDGSPQVAIEDILQPYLPQGNNSTYNALRTIQDKIYFCPAAIPPFSISSPQYPNTYDGNMGVHIRLCPNAAGQYPPLKRLSTLPRLSDTIAIADTSQNTAIGNSGSGYLDDTGTQWGPDNGDHAWPGGDGWVTSGGQVGFDDPARTDWITDNYPSPPTAPFAPKGIWSDLTEQSPYHIRSRHNQNTAANALMADGHAATWKHNTILYKNLTTAY